MCVRSLAQLGAERVSGKLAGTFLDPVASQPPNAWMLRRSLESARRQVGPNYLTKLRRRCGDGEVDAGLAVCGATGALLEVVVAVRSGAHHAGLRPISASSVTILTDSGVLPAASTTSAR